MRDLTPTQLLLVVGFLQVLNWPAMSQSTDAPPPNILWIVSEDNSPFLGCYGDPMAVTPHIDGLAGDGILYERAFANAPVCAPSRSCLITGMYANSLGTQHMRSINPVPDFVEFLPGYLKRAGYFTTNRKKKDYNTIDQPEVWDNADWWNWEEALQGRRPDQPFFMMYNTWMSHEDKIHQGGAKAKSYYEGTLAAFDTTFSAEARMAALDHTPGEIPLPPYHPDTKAMRQDWAHYYNCIQMMDDEVGLILQKLEEEGLADQTIVFYFSDHGGVLGRSKRFPYESGLRVPLIIRFPEQYSYLASGAPGSRNDRIVSFVDFAPTVLSLAGIDIPDYMQGRPFLGPQTGEPARYAFGFRGRMDERYDMVRTVRSGIYRYNRNYMPHRIYGGHIQFLWKAASMRSWQEACAAGDCNEVQQRFWEAKATEELYDVSHDPHNVHNLAEDPAYADILDELRQAESTWVDEVRDAGFLPESMMMRRSAGSTPFDLMHGEKLPWETIVATARLTGEGDAANLNTFIDRLSHEDGAVRYWAAIGCAVLGMDAKAAREPLRSLTTDPFPSVRIAAAEALYQLGDRSTALLTLRNILRDGGVWARQHPEEKYAPEVFELTQALNVLDFCGKDARVAYKEVKALAEGKTRYFTRLASYLAERLDPAKAAGGK